MGASRRRTNQLAAAEGEAAREVAADHARFSEANKAAAAAAPSAPRRRAAPAPPAPRPWWHGYLTTVVLSFAAWSFMRMLLRNQAWAVSHKAT
jgi:type VI protein secretion system component VasF